MLLLSTQTMDKEARACGQTLQGFIRLLSNIEEVFVVNGGQTYRGVLEDQVTQIRVENPTSIGQRASDVAQMLFID